ncbi:hypothetical protein HZS_276, partial [Henneguya salminicola]
MKSLSLFAQYVKNGTYPSRYHKVITLVSDKSHPHLSAKSNNTNSMEPKEKWPTVSFPVNIAELGITIEEKIEKLEDISRQNIFKRIDRFRTLVKAYNWTDPGARIFLPHVMDYSLHDVVAPLITEKCTANRAVELYQKLKSLKQDDFYHIKDYYKEIVDTVKLLAVIKKWGKSETKNRIAESFLSGLNTVTEIEMAKFQAFTMEEILSRIIDVEAPKKSEPYKPRTTKTEDNNRYIYSESQNLISSVDMAVNLNESSYMAIIDTGAESSYISQQICTEEKIPLNKVKRYQIVYGNGSKESGDKIASTTLNIKSINYNFTQDFKIIPNLRALIILGMDFMINNDASIDIKSRAIFVNRNRISLLSHSKPNQIVVEKAKLCQVASENFHWAEEDDIVIKNIFEEIKKRTLL